MTATDAAAERAELLAGADITTTPQEDIRAWALDATGIDPGDHLATAVLDQARDAEHAMALMLAIVERARLLKRPPDPDDDQDDELDPRLAAGAEARRCGRYLRTALRHGGVAHRVLLRGWTESGGAASTYYKIRRHLGLLEHDGLVRWRHPEADHDAVCRCVSRNGDPRPLRLQRDQQSWICSRCGKVANP